MVKVFLSLFSFCYFNIKNPAIQEIKKTFTISMKPSSVRQWSVTARCCGGLMVQQQINVLLKLQAAQTPLYFKAHVWFVSPTSERSVQPTASIPAEEGGRISSVSSCISKVAPLLSVGHLKARWCLTQLLALLSSSLHTFSPPHIGPGV